MDESYPLTYSVEYPDRELDRLTTFFRVFMVIPIAIVLATVDHYLFGGWGDQATGYVACGRDPVLRTAADDPVPEKYPRWWFDWNRELLRFRRGSTPIPC